MNEQLDMSSLDLGFSREGMKQYIENLRLNMLEEAKKAIDDFGDVEININRAWQGQARDKFLREFEDARTKVKEDLDLEFNDLEARLSEIGSFYLKQDQNMMGGE